jgi:copper transport protein
MLVDKRQRQILLRTFIILFSIIMIAAMPKVAFSHALLEKAKPAPDAHLQSAPKEIVLLFNERLEDELYSIKVFNNKGEMISTSKTELSLDQKQLKHPISSLENGSYTISYSVLSSDGHPIKGSYIFSVGKASGEIVKPEQDVKNEFSIVKILYYIALLLVTGWMLWGKKIETFLENIKSYRKIALYLQLFFLVTNISWGYVQFVELVNSWEEFNSLLSGTAIGVSWGISMLLSILGFAILFRFNWLDRVWAFVLLTAKSINGHAMGFDPAILTVLLDLVHLIAAALWAGGLFYIVILLRKQRGQVGQFMATFSKVALVSVIVLTISGMVLTLTYLPDLNYLFYTQWGSWLIAKMVLVILVIVLGSVIRLYLKKKKVDTVGTLIKVDFALMISITLIVGILTNLSPLPENKPLIWKMQEDYIEFSATISPKAPGGNLFMIEANSEKEGIDIKRIELFLKNKDNLEVAPIPVTFPTYEQAKMVHYMVNGPYLPFAGNWIVEIRILDTEDNEHVYHEDMKVY